MHTVSIHLTVIVHVPSHNYMLQCLGGLGLKRLHLVQLFFSAFAIIAKPGCCT